MPRYKKVKDDVPSFNYWKLDHEKKIQVARVRTKITSDLYILSPHRLDHYALRLVHFGSGQVFIDHISYTIQKNWLMLATPEQTSWLKIPENTVLEFSVIAFSQRLIDLMGFAENVKAMISGPHSHLDILLNEENAITIKKYFDLLVCEFENQTQPSDNILAALTKALLLRLFEMKHMEVIPSKRHKTYENIYRQYLSVLEKHYRESHYVADYVDRLFISEKQLNRACKHMTNRSARQIISQHLDFEAKRLLFYSHNTVKEIGYHLGFKDPAHFNKFFKKHNKVTPKEFRNQL